MSRQRHPNQAAEDRETVLLRINSENNVFTYLFQLPMCLLFLLCGLKKTNISAIKKRDPDAVKGCLSKSKLLLSDKRLS